MEKIILIAMLLMALGLSQYQSDNADGGGIGVDASTWPINK